MFRSIRTGLFAALAGFTVLICVCYTGLALVISYVTEDMLVDRLLQREAQIVAEHLLRHGEIKSADNELIQIYTGIATLPSAVNEYVMAGHARGEVFTDTGQHYHFRALDLQSAGQRIYLVADVGPLLVVSKLFQEVGGVLTAVALGLIALALLLAYWLSRRLVSPLLALANEVRSVTPGGSIDFSGRQRRDEIGYLADKLGTTFTELHSALDREHAFTRDVSHELRTPLTIMNNTLGQAASRPLEQHDVAQLKAGVDEIGKTIEVLFALARAEHIASETFDLRRHIEESLLRLLDEGGWDSERLALHLPDRLPVTGNLQLSILLINNCLGNAVFHGGAGSQLQISFADGVLSLTNTIDPDRVGSIQGFLHGQNLLLRIAKAMRWQLAFHAGASAYRVDIVPLPAD